MIINDLDGYYIVFDTKNWNTELDTLVAGMIIPKTFILYQLLIKFLITGMFTHT